MLNAGLPTHQNSIGLILAGGESQRFQPHGHKALQLFQDQYLLEHVLQRVQPQVSKTILSLHNQQQYLEPGFQTLIHQYHLEYCFDEQASHQGPLAGLANGLEILNRLPLNYQWLFLAPCDAPFIPPNLLTQMSNHMHNEDVPESYPVAMAVSEQRLQPTFSLWHRDSLCQVKQALSGQRRSFWSAIDETKVQRCDLKYDPIQFLNINSPQELADALKYCSMLS